MVELIKKAKNGETSALIELFDLSIHSTYYICSSLMASEALAIDACVSTYKRVFASLDNIDENVNFVEWMKNAAAVTCCTELRRSDRNVFISPEETDIFAPKVDRNSILNMEQTAAVLENRFETMPIAVRCALILYYFNSLLPSQIARVMCIPNERVKELLLAGRDKLEELQKTLDALGVETCRMVMLPIMEFSSVNQDLPKGIDAYSILGIQREEIIEEPTPKKPIYKNKLFLLFAFLMVVVIFSLILAFGGKKENKDNNSSTASISSQIVEEEANSDESPKLPVCNYDFKKITYYNENDELEKTVYYKYDKKGRVVYLKTETELFSEELNYVYKGKTLTVTNHKGDTIETSQLDKNGNTVKSTFSKNNVVNYKWKYKYNKGGFVIKETFKSENKGSRVYERDAQGRILSVVNTLNGNSVKTEYKYDENEMVIEKIETDSKGNQKIYNYTYDYNSLQFHGKVSNGEYFYGDLVDLTK